MKTTIRTETARDVLGVPGRAHNVVTWAGNGNPVAPWEIANQKWVSERRSVDSAEWGRDRFIRVSLRFDDSCRNGYMSFGITGEIYKPGARDIEAGGCIHDEIQRYFPELAPLVQWHLFDTRGPIHYIANTVYHASDRDHRGKRAGEPYAWDYAVTFGANPIAHKLSDKFATFLRKYGCPSRFDFEVIRVDHRDRGKPEKYQFGPKFTFGGFGEDWHGCPFDTEESAVNFLTALQTCDPKFIRIPVMFSEGKVRDLDAARRCANWPDAPESILTGDEATLTAALEARLPAMLDGFRAAMVDSCGFIYGASDPVKGGDA
jgi:hypothetical protein